jgi:Heparinase II/III-like protein
MCGALEVSAPFVFGREFVGVWAGVFVNSYEPRATSHGLTATSFQLPVSSLYSRGMDRRTFLAASAAVLGQGLVGPAEMLAMAVDAAPMNLLGSTFGSLALLAAKDWKPVPKASDRAGWEALPQDVRATLVKNADKANTSDWPILLATEELDFKRTGNRTHFETLSFGRRGRLGDLVIGECVAGSGKYLDQISNGVWLICEESFWGVPAHLGAQKAGEGLADVVEPIIELFGAETAATLAWVSYLLPEGLHSVSPLLLPRIAMEAKRRIFDPYFVRNDFWWMGLNGGKKLNNWNPWINSNVLTAALLLEPDGPRRGQIVEKVCRSVDRFLSEYSPDGACEEGPGYWARSAASFFDCARTLVSAHGGKGVGVLTHPFTRAMGHYICDVHIAKSFYVNYGDAHVEAAPEPELLYSFGQATGDAMLADFGAFEAARRSVGFGTGVGGVASLSREVAKVLTVGAMRGGEKQDALPRDAWYPKLGLMTAREKTGSAEGFYVALQAASNGRPHGHNDSGSFIVFYCGEPVFIDVGVEAYTAQTFGKDRYKLWTMQSGFHNLPTIGGVMQHEGDAFQATGLQYESGARTSVSANLATAYPKEAGVSRWDRTLTLDRGARKVELAEEFRLSREAPVMLSFMCAKEPVVSADGVKVGGVLLGFDGAVLKATVEKIALTDAGLKHSWGDAVWRVMLASVGLVTKGSWRMEMRGP